MTELTAKQQKFCEEYMVDLNATQSAIRAGYAANSLNAFRVIGCHNLRKVNIKAEIQHRKAVISEETGITVKWVVNSLKEVAERCMDTNPVLDNKGNKTGEWQFDAGGANRSLQLLGMHVGAFEADNAQKGDKTINIINFSNIDDTKQIISGQVGPARIAGSPSV